MRSLSDLLTSPDGVAFLESEGVVADRAHFVRALKPPVTARLADLLGAEDGRLVYAAQQVSIDYRESVLCKLRDLASLEREAGLSGVFISVDTDRSGAHAGPNAVHIMWPLEGREHPVRISPSAFDAVESRFVPVDPARLTSAIDRLGAYVRQSGLGKSPGARSRLERLRALFVEPAAGTLSEFNDRVTGFLLSAHLGLRLRSVMLSELINRGLITDDVNVFINHLEQMRLAFNGAVTDLAARGINPQVKPVGEDYLPVHFSCAADNRRLRLRRVAEGRDQFAVAGCPCGASYRFFLGTERLSIDELARTNRWSPDVCLLMFLNDLVSGAIVGKSSGLYGMVLNRVLKAVRKEPVSMLVPGELRQAEARRADSLMYSYLAGGPRG